MSIKAMALTSGSVTPGLQEAANRPYRWRGVEGWRDDDPRIGIESRNENKQRPGTGTAQAAGRLQRLAVYCEHRDRGVPEAEAAEAAGVGSRKTITRYEKVWTAARGHATGEAQQP